jgi:2-oxoglutarate/2-oxoacid ferredoxin oxidoreductase subunit alpha
VTGLTHDDRGYPAMNAVAQDKMVKRQYAKIEQNVDDIVQWEEKNLSGAEVVVVSFGITSRVAERAMQQARDKGVKVGSFRLITAWPFPEKQIVDLSKKVKAFVVPELNMGQMVLEVERLAAGRCRTVAVPHAGGTVHQPEVITAAILEAVR